MRKSGLETCDRLFLHSTQDPASSILKFWMRQNNLLKPLPVGNRLTALLCILCVFSRLLFIIDDEPAWSLLAVAWAAAVEECYLQARGARRLCCVVQSFIDGWTARWAATSTMSGVIGG